MESVAILVEGGEWSSFDGISVNEEADFMAKLFSSSSLNNELEISSLSLSSSCYSGHESNFGMAGGDSGSFYSTDTDSNLYSLSQGSSYSGSSDNSAFPCHENYHLSDPHQFLVVNGSSLPIDFCLTDTKNFIDVFPSNPMERDHTLNPEMSCDNLEESGGDLAQPEHLQLKNEYDMLENEPAGEEKSSDSSESGKKRSRNSEVQKGKRNVRSKKSDRLGSDDEDNGPAINWQNSGSCSSEEESTGLQDLSAGSSNGTAAVSVKGKTRASRGSATDPQSLYARKRRERINERLRILQNLVPNGTKVDISTMLEEAVQYVKFLQTQIKLLSSDELWMYAPLAYNGMDIGLDSKINALL